MYVTVKDNKSRIAKKSKKNRLKNAIIKENKQKHHQTETTCTFLINPLKNCLGPTREGPVTNLFLNGSYSYITPISENKQTRQFLEVCSLKDREHVMQTLEEQRNSVLTHGKN